MRDSSAPPLSKIDLERLIDDARNRTVSTDTGAGQALTDALVAMAADPTPATEAAVRRAYKA